MSARPINVLIYSGPGTSLNSVRQATWSLRRLLGPNYAVVTVTADQILKEPWTHSCALLVIPGGADLNYCKNLNGQGNRRIRQYVEMGGRYLGFCAGGYYGAAKCDFEAGRKGWEVVGDRELAFFPGTCRGLAFPGFVYASEKGARAVKLTTSRDAFPSEIAQGFRSYYNGGGVFVDAERMRERNVEILARYEEDLAVDSGQGGAAVVFCKVEKGSAILTGPHPEFSGANLQRDETSNPKYTEIIDALQEDNEKRTNFMKACLVKLGLEVSQEPQAVPSLSRLHLSSAQPQQIAELVQSWRTAGIVNFEGSEEYIQGGDDTFHIESTTPWSMSSMRKAAEDLVPGCVKNSVSTALSATNGGVRSAQADASSSPHRIVDNDSDKHLSLRLVLYQASAPDPKETSQFNHHAFYTHLSDYQNKHHRGTLSGDFGRTLLYGEVVTSTNTLLEKNPTLLSNLPIGTTFVATTQIAGRGRGGNVWVSPPGTLAFSTIMKHGFTGAPVVFVQYLIAMAAVAGIKGYDRGYEKMPIKLKWPNDIYAATADASTSSKDTMGTSSPPSSSYVKVGGILINTSYTASATGAEYTLVVGLGLNVHNPSPTTSLSRLATSLNLAPFQLEKLLASILTHFETLYARFNQCGFDASFEREYYSAWLHTDQIVTLENEGGVKAKIKGITTDWGLLLAEEVMEGAGGARGFASRLGQGRMFALQSDSNSFDFFRGLVRRKL